MLRAFPTALMLRAVAPGKLRPARRFIREACRSLDRHARIRWLVEEHIELVARTLRNAGVPQADLDDEVQRTFIIAVRRLDDVQPGAERAFLCQVALNLAWHARRSFARRREIPSDQVPEPVETRATPEELIDRMQVRQHLDGIIDRMDESLRAVFKLFVIDELNLAEIAQLLRIPRGTVASRLRRAREQLRKHVGAIDLAWTLGAKGAKRIDEPASIWQKKLGALERALLRAERGCPPGPGRAPRRSPGSVWPDQPVVSTSGRVHDAGNQNAAFGAFRDAMKTHAGHGVVFVSFVALVALGDLRRAWPRGRHRYVRPARSRPARSCRSRRRSWRARRRRPAAR